MNETSNWDLAYKYGMSGMSNLANSLSAFGAAATASGNAKIAKLNKERMNRNYTAAIDEMKTNKALNLASNRMDFVLSGFRVDKGTAGTTGLVQDLTTKVYNKDIDMLRLNQQTENKIYDRQIKSFNEQAKADRHQGLFSGIMSVVDTVATIAMLI